jgi:hypothetical protein
VTCALPDFLFATMCACIHSVPSQIRVIDAVDADCIDREGRICPDSLLVEGTRQNLLILASGTERGVLRQSCPGLLVCDNDDIIVAYEKTPA